MRKTVTCLHVRAISACATRGILSCGGLTVRCALGRSGRKHRKVEGDGASPVGLWTLHRVFYRSDKLRPPQTALPLVPLRSGWGWCETVGDRNYNRLVRLPYRASHEELKRSDDLYDIVIETSHNRRPRIQGLGSAIFFHLAREGYTPTAGCIAVSRTDMRKLLKLCSGTAKLVISPPAGLARPVFRK